MTQQINYVASPTGIKFHKSQALVRAIRGVVGSGKSVMCVEEMLIKSMTQKPNAEGIRKTRWGCIRNTYPELKSTVIKTFQDWIPESVCPIKYDSPISGTMQLPLPDGSSVYAEFMFVSIDKPKDVQKLMSFEFTGIWINECQFIDRAIITEALSRTGRYPSMKDGGCSWSGLIMDTNSPDDDHWYYQDEQVNTPDKWEFFIQPPALLKQGKDYVPNPLAENVENHSKGYDYWLDLVSGQPENWVKSRILNEYATVETGKPIYKDHFNQHIHISQDELWPIKSLPIVLGFDFGLTPSCIIGQITPTGQLRILDELVATRIGIESFITEVVVPLLNTKYKSNPREVVGDPAGVAKSDTDERSCFEVLEQFGFDAEPARSNNPTARWEAVRYFLSRMSGGQPSIVINKTCKTLIKGFISGYQFRRLNVSGEARYQEKADKNAYSHPHDALQYLCLLVCPDPNGFKDDIKTNHDDHSSHVGDSVTGY